MNTGALTILKWMAIFTGRMNAHHLLNPAIYSMKIAPLLMKSAKELIMIALLQILY